MYNEFENDAFKIAAASYNDSMSLRLSNTHFKPYADWVIF